MEDPNIRFPTLALVEPELEAELQKLSEAYSLFINDDICVEIEREVEDYVLMQENASTMLYMASTSGDANSQLLSETTINNIIVSQNIIESSLSEKSLKETQTRTLTAHLVNGVFTCGECEYQTLYKRNFQFHSLTHSNTHHFKCNKCEFRTTYKQNLNRHLLEYSDHHDSEQYKCDHCEFKTCYQHSLKRHLRGHPDIYKYKCDYCKYRTDASHMLKKHSLTHSKSRYKCDQSDCDFKSNHKQSLIKHLKKHSNVRLECNLCKYKTPSKGYLQKHFLFKHPDDYPYDCMNMCTICL